MTNSPPAAAFARQGSYSTKAIRRLPITSNRFSPRYVRLAPGFGLSSNRGGGGPGAAGTRPEDEECCGPGESRPCTTDHPQWRHRNARREVRLALRARLRSVMDRYGLLAMATVPVEPFDEWCADTSQPPQGLR